MALFDGYVAVDWSANGRPKQGMDSIWIAVRGWGGTAEPANPATRAGAVDRIEALIGSATEAGSRLLCGFDFPFGYPAGTARMLTGRGGWEAVWSRIADAVEDGPDNANNRFDAAASLNASFAGDGPFWGNGLKRDIPGLPRRKPTGWGTTLPPNRRHAESEVRRAQEVWKLVGNGSVGDRRSPESRGWSACGTGRGRRSGRSRPSAKAAATCWPRSTPRSSSPRTVPR